MPEFDPRDYEVMIHEPMVEPFGEHSIVHDCGKKTRQEHLHPRMGLSKWFCTRKKNHMGRHEAGVEQDDGWKVLCSWADPPTE